MKAQISENPLMPEFLNIQQGFEKYEHTLLYLNGLFNKYMNDGRFSNHQKAIMELSCKCGENDVVRFSQSLIPAWLKLRKPIPGIFLLAIGVKAFVLNYVIELDNEAWQAACKQQPRLRGFLLKTNSGIFRSRVLSRECTPDEAIASIRQSHQNNLFEAVVPVKDLFSIKLSGPHEKVIQYYEPSYKINKQGCFVFKHHRLPDLSEC